MPSGEPEDRCGMAVVSSGREMLGEGPQRAQPLASGTSDSGGDSGDTAPVNGEEGGDDVKSSWPLCRGLHTCYNGKYKGAKPRESAPST